MRAPREIDELMWDVAEKGDDATCDQFNSRYPEFVDELAKRRQMIGTLRGSRPRSDVPRFVPREQVRHFGPSRLAVAGIAVLVLASVTLATFATMQIVNSKKSDHGVVEKPVEIVFNPPDFGAPLAPSDDQADKTPLSAEDVQPLQTNVPAQDIYLGKITIKSDDISLEKAINDMAAQAGLEAVIAPGFEDKRIRISFVDQPLMGVLHQLGVYFGFTPFRQGSAEILIVPAVAKDTKGVADVPGIAVPATGSPDGEGNAPGGVTTKDPASEKKPGGLGEDPPL
jgi:hypothetical protein